MKRKRQIRGLVTFGILFCLLVQVLSLPVSASTESIQTNYGVACCNCGEYDYMKLIGFEQVGIGGTMYQLIYTCSKCGAVTYQTFYAR